MEPAVRLALYRSAALGQQIDEQQYDGDRKRNPNPPREEIQSQPGYPDGE
jgi:hypothetical protein